MIVIYTTAVTNRLVFILDTVFREYYGLEYRLVTNPADAPAEAVRINYSETSMPGWFSVFRETLLFETGIHDQRPFISRVAGMPVIFQTQDDYDLNFDLFAAAFYLLSRYEEYLPHEQDPYGRFRATNSILSNPAFAFAPIVETWLVYFRDRLRERYPNLAFKEHHTAVELTFDIDQAFAYKGRRWPKILGPLAKQAGRRVLFFGDPDPYDTFSDIFRFLNDRQAKARFFFLLNDKGAHNSSVNPNSPELIRRIRDCARSHQVGLHPSFDSMETSQISNEKALLEQHAGVPVLHSRQHFLRIRFPDYFNRLISLGIQHDHSLGYADTPGFRAGFSRPFRFFDLKANCSTHLWLHPFAYMDATFIYYLQPDQTQIITKILQILKQVSKVNGKLVTVSHNDLLGDSCPVDFWEVLKNCAV